LSKGGLRATFLLGGGILYVVFLGAAIYQLAL
jgi:hypothetical protein